MACSLPCIDASFESLDVCLNCSIHRSEKSSKEPWERASVAGRIGWTGVKGVRIKEQGSLSRVGDGESRERIRKDN